MKPLPALALILCFLPSPAYPLDHGFPKDTDRSAFFSNLKRPDFYPKSCCGEADGYEADIYQRNADGSYDVEITEGSAKVFPDGSTRPELKDGTRVHVPATQINPPIETMLNPTGHAWLFVSIVRPVGSGDAVPGLTYCFAPLPEGS
jgi:hypothetical protein